MRRLIGLWAVPPYSPLFLTRALARMRLAIIRPRLFAETFDREVGLGQEPRAQTKPAHYRGQRISKSAKGFRERGFRFSAIVGGEMSCLQRVRNARRSRESTP